MTSGCFANASTTQGGVNAREPGLTIANAGVGAYNARTFGTARMWQR